MEKKINISNEVIREILPYLLEGSLHGVYGKAGSGKTTFCLHIAKDYLANNRKVIYIDTENGFFIERLLSIPPNTNNLQNLLVKKVFDLKELRETLKETKELLSKDNEIGLLIIDSLSNPYRVEGKDQGGIGDINRMMGRTIHELKKIAFHHKISILATHQVYTLFETGETEIVGRDLVKYDFKVMISIEQSNSKRHLRLIRHPYLEEKGVTAVIKKEGFSKKRII